MTGVKLDNSMQLLPTNLSGVFTKVRSTDNVAEPLSIAPLIHSKLLTRLKETDTSAVRRFREKILACKWRPEDQITPLLEPQVGATHQLTTRVEVTVFTHRRDRPRRNEITNGRYPLILSAEGDCHVRNTTGSNRSHPTQIKVWS
jgi:hypothetical protein